MSMMPGKSHTHAMKMMLTFMVNWKPFCNYSVTRFGEILPLWHNFKSVGQIFEVCLIFRRFLYSTLAKMLCYYASFHYCRRPNILK